MKKTILTLCTVFLVFSVLSPQQASSQESSFNIPLSASYSSVYWWRGVELNNTENPKESVGVFWSGIAIEYGGLSIFYATGISEDMWRRRNTEDLENDGTGNGEDDLARDKAKEKTEMDYGVSYEFEIKPLTILASVIYFQYPFFDETDKSNTAIDPSLWEVGISLGVDTILSPSIECYWDYYVEERKSDTNPDEETPINEDYYVKLAVSQEIAGKKDVYSFAIGAWAGYYNNAYFELKGWSDAGSTLSLSTNHENLSIKAAVYYARTLDKDFKKAAGYVKNHTWCDFGITYKLL